MRLWGKRPYPANPPPADPFKNCPGGYVYVELIANLLFANPCCYTQNPDAFKRRKGDK